MMRLARRTTLLVAFSLLTSAATAHAGCAWVLCEERSGIAKKGVWPTEWNISGAAQTQTECSGFAQRAVRDRAERGRKTGEVKAEGNQVTVKFKPVGIERVDLLEEMSFRYLCLPDTVDPRGPKGR